ncbi:MAG TPA: SulP family inorganic anion transporter [Pseudolabrys sp.]|nr:SulP family inorganic anion transporter [Pseudolabrys sp.]
MSTETAREAGSNDTRWRKELKAGAVAAVLGLPMCLAAGVLVFAPLGHDYVAEGAAAGLFGFIIAGAVAALLSTSSFVVTVPRASPALVLATLVAGLLIDQNFAGNPALVVVAAALCVFMSGLWQILFGIFRVARAIKFTPHPVVAGFANGAALLIIKAQIKPFFVDGDGTASLLPHHPWMLVFVVGIALLALCYQRLAVLLRLPEAAANVPGALAAFALGTGIYYVILWILPSVDIGPAIGRPDVTLASPLLALWQPENLAHVLGSGWNILLVSLVLAIVASLETLMSLRAAQNIADLSVHPVRELAAQGLGNCAAALLAPISSASSPSLTVAAYRAGGRTRLSGLFASAFILVVGVAFSGAVAAVPNGVLAAVLLAIGVTMIDSWSLRLFSRLLRKSSPTWRRDLHDAIVVVAVMGATFMTTVVIGVITGCLLAALIFVINMSRPVVRRSYLGHEIFSKRTRSSDDIAILQKTGQRRAVLQLEGVLFFGNAEDLSLHVKTLFEQADIVVLDMRAVTDIDASGSAILAALVKRARTRGKKLLFCNVAPEQSAQVRTLFDAAGMADAAIKPDLETALEWAEEEILLDYLNERGSAAMLPLDEIDFFTGVSADELKALHRVLKLREFAAGEAICREGDAGDRMWLLAKGSVSVRLEVKDQRGSRRIASLGRGTVFGEMALIEGARRSASIVADEAVACYELTSEDFAVLLRDSPGIAATIMRNTARELARRLRRTSEDLRHAAS